MCGNVRRSSRCLCKGCGKLRVIGQRLPLAPAIRTRLGLAISAALGDPPGKGSGVNWSARLTINANNNENLTDWWNVETRGTKRRIEDISDESGNTCGDNITADEITLNDEEEEEAWQKEWSAMEEANAAAAFYSDDEEILL